MSVNSSVCDINVLHLLVKSPACSILTHLHTLILQKGDYDSALEIFFKILRGLQSDDGDKPHLLGSCWHNIGTIQSWQGKHSDAKESFEQAVAVRDVDLPPNHPDLAVSLMRYSLALFALGHLSESILALNRALTMHPKDSMTRAKILNNLGVVHYQSQDLVSALKHFTAALEIQREWLDGPVRRESIVYDATVTLGNMGKCYLQRQDYVTACFVYEEALLLQMTAFRKDHDIVLVSLSNLAHAKAKEGDAKKSIQIYRGILKSQDSKYGENSKPAAETQSILGQMYLSQYNYEEALKCFTSVREWQKLNLDPNHPAALYVSATVKMAEEKIQGEVSVWI
jgi:tetratricopeptide (TPR) repeat protein